jgi:anti-anti-sigma factor
MPGGVLPVELVRGVPVVAAPAEIDVSNADLLRAAVLAAAAHGHGTFVVDMTRTTFCNSAGLGVLVQAHKRAVAGGGVLRLVIPANALVLSVLAITGLDRLIPCFTSLDLALQPAPTAPPPGPAAAAARPRRRRPRPKPGMRTPGDGPPPGPGAQPSPA